MKPFHIGFVHGSPLRGVMVQSESPLTLAKGEYDFDQALDTCLEIAKRNQFMLVLDNNPIESLAWQRLRLKNVQEDDVQ